MWVGIAVSVVVVGSTPLDRVAHPLPCACSLVLYSSPWVLPERKCGFGIAVSAVVVGSTVK